MNVDLPENGRVSGKSALMIWNRPRKDVILTEAEHQVAGALTVTLTDDPADIAAQLKHLLGDA
ncbi:hypothetical protein ACFOPQ_06390 [Deinococcus antarcticus]|uniref:Uncharacterized protein n=2 Tax=Deinococcus TaxID=1298 RepID=A0A418VJ21_9DEIO|nr:hypothetical protein [Deinococcus cavernae]RJF76149.1 hypothetical protein D3875_00075 [Deinococcus cavernae]